jgi:uncharacterized protein YqkB
LRASGSLDFFWNYRVVDSLECQDRLFEGYVEDIDSDFGFLYYKRVQYIWGKDKIENLEAKTNTVRLSTAK